MNVVDEYKLVYEEYLQALSLRKDKQSFLQFVAEKKHLQKYFIKELLGRRYLFEDASSLELTSHEDLAITRAINLNDAIRIVYRASVLENSTIIYPTSTTGFEALIMIGYYPLIKDILQNVLSSSRGVVGTFCGIAGRVNDPYFLMLVDKYKVLEKELQTIENVQCPLITEMVFKIEDNQPPAKILTLDYKRNAKHYTAINYQ
ncbi:MAG: hypothetical protein RSA48_02660 [Bacilli bacterium]